MALGASIIGAQFLVYDESVVKLIRAIAERQAFTCGFDTDWHEYQDQREEIASILSELTGMSQFEASGFLGEIYGAFKLHYRGEVLA